MGKLAAFLEQVIRRICEASTWTIGALNVQPGHAHLFLNAPPSLAPINAGVQLALPTACATRWSEAVIELESILSAFHKAELFLISCKKKE